MRDKIIGKMLGKGWVRFSEICNGLDDVKEVRTELEAMKAEGIVEDMPFIASHVAEWRLTVKAYDKILKALQ